MNIVIKPGTYVLAVSGGVDSVVLLDMLAGQPGLEIIVAHFDHGIREDSRADRKFVEGLAKQYGLAFKYAEGKLGKNVSEQTARQARYAFLRKVQQTDGAKAIITAHHQDDVIETMLINLIRGTKRKGLSSLQDQPDILRPLLQIPKKELLAYAKQKKLAWHEDSTNTDTTYLRNWVRAQLMPKLTEQERKLLLDSNTRLGELNQELDELLRADFQTDKATLSKKALLTTPHDVAREVIADWLRHNDIADFDKATIERLVIGAKTLQNGKTVDIKKGSKMLVGQQELTIVSQAVASK